MVRRDQFIRNVSDRLSRNKVSSEVENLIRLIDSKLQEETSIIQWTNKHELSSTSGVERLELDQTDWRAVHHDPTAQNPESGFSSNNYAIYDENVLTQDSEPANQTPWFDRTFSIVTQHPFVVYLPINTTANAARLAAKRYKERGIGYWDLVPELGNDAQQGTSGTISVDAVKLFWDHDSNTFYLEFHLS